MKRVFIITLSIALMLMAIFNATQIDFQDLQSGSSQLAYINILANILLLVAMVILYFLNSGKISSKN